MARIVVRLLGGFQARLEPGGALSLPTRKSQALLAYLALSLGRAHPRDQLAALLWGGIRQESARASLRQALFAIRKGLGDSSQALRLEGDTVALDPAAVDVDAVTFQRAVSNGAPDGVERATALYHGDLLSGFAVDEAPFEEWLLGERERLRELALGGLARQLTHQRKAGNGEAAVQTALQLLVLEPLQEPVHRTLMRLYEEQGRRGAALRQYQHCVGILQRELGLEPEAETKSLYQEILRRRSARGLPDELPASVAAASAPVRPYIPGSEGALIGRETDLRQLRQTLAGAWSGRGQVVAVVGEAGIGKTRLIAELVADAERQGGRILLGGAHESEQVLPFGPWVDALHTGQVADDLTDLAPAWRAELARLMPQLAVSPATGDRSTDHLQLFESVVEAIGHLASRQPLLVVLEDLHWADDMSARLLTFAGRRLGARPILVVATARDEDLADVPVLRHGFEELQREGRLTRVSLGPLSRQDTLTLVRLHARTGSAEATLARLGEQAWIASEGNPFVIVEIVRANTEGVPPVEGRSLRLPERVREVISGRLEQVSHRGQALAAVAAVIGREFDFALLQRASGLEDGEVAESIEELVRRRILHGVGEGFGFIHERIRAVVYEVLLGVRRRTLHAAVGAALEHLHAGQLDAVYDRLAHHYTQADDAAKAAEYLTRFARKATRTHAHEEAVRAYGEALRQLERLSALEADAGRLDIVPRLTRSLMFLGRFDEARDLLLTQHERVEKMDNASLTGQYHLLLSHVYGFLGDRARTVENATRAVVAAERAADEATIGKASYVLGMEGWWAGDPQRGIEHGRRAVVLLERTSERWWLGQAHFAVAANCVLMGDFEPALDAATEALTIGAALGDPRVQTPAAWLTGTIHAMRGDWDAGIAAGRRSLEYSPDPVNRADALGWLGFAYLENGDAEEAIRLLEQSVAQWSQFGVRPAQGGFRILLGHAYLMCDDVDRAARLAEEGMAFTRETRYRLGVGWAERLLALVAERRRDRPRAHALLEQALSTFTAISAAFEAARTRLLLGEVCSRLGDHAAAVHVVEEARHAFVALRTPRYARWTEALARDLGTGRLSATPDRLPRWAPVPRES
jgi:DNA-binding SARP family transcriptional activator/tetratricopeptide (TPR) repeat protein